jgi:hypothetical protein
MGSEEPRLYFRRTFTDQMIQCWDDLHAVVEHVSEGGIESDALIWGCEKTGVYSSHSFYAIINYRGVMTIYIPAIWSVMAPPKIQLFLWLLSHSKLATVDNLNKRELARPVQCCFCAENECGASIF